MTTEKIITYTIGGLIAYSLLKPKSTTLSLVDCQVPSCSFTVTDANPCANAPPEYKADCNIINTWLDSKIVEWKPTSLSNIKFNGHLIFQSENLIDIFPEIYDNNFIDMIMELNTDSISLHIQPQLYIQYKTRYDNIITKIKTTGKELYIAYQMPTLTSITLNEYIQTETTFINNFITLHKPTYFVVVDEYTTMVERTKLVATDSEWKNMVMQFCTLVKSISPTTKTGVNVHSRELTFANTLTDIYNLNFIAFSIWGIELLDETTPYGLDVKNTIQNIQSYGKDVIFEQTWSIDRSNKPPELLALDFIKEFDPKYTTAIIYYCIKYGIVNYNPYYTGKFITYEEDQSLFLQSLLNNERTPVFNTYKDLIITS